MTLIPFTLCIRRPSKQTTDAQRSRGAQRRTHDVFNYHIFNAFTVDDFIALRGESASKFYELLGSHEKIPKRSNLRKKAKGG